MKKAGNHTCCKVRVIDNGHERLHAKTTAFSFQAPSRGALNHNFEMEKKKAENHTYCKDRVADGGNERLPFQNCCVRLSGAFKGAEPLNYPVAT